MAAIRSYNQRTVATAKKKYFKNIKPNKNRNYSASARQQTKSYSASASPQAKLYSASP